MRHNFIFVYGLLKSIYENEPAKFIRRNCTLIGDGIIPGRLYDLGNYPGVIYDKNSFSKVYGEVYLIDRNEKELVQFLDNFEGVGSQFKQPNEYIRSTIPVNISTGVIESSTYLYNWNLEKAKVIDSGKYESIKGNR